MLMKSLSPTHQRRLAAAEGAVMEQNGKRVS
jgi:hypothetical protein